MQQDNRPSYPIKKLVGFDERMLAAINRWRRQRLPIPHANGAIRELIKLGLAASKHKESQHARQ
jgi:hypothetical protein